MTLACLRGQAATYHVVASGGNDASNGLSWAAALATIPAAMAKAGDGDTVKLSNGLYNVTAQINLTSAVTFTSANGREKTTIDAGNVAGRRVFHMNHAGAVIDGLTIRRGSANAASSPSQHGGGVWLSAGRVQNCLITNNIGYTSGGNVYMTGGTVSNCVLAKGNASDQQGGGVFINGSGAVVEYSTIRDNTALREGSGVGFGASGGTVRNCEIVENYAPNREDAIYMAAGLVENSLVARNTSGNYYGRGTISLYGAGEVRYCTVVDNVSAGSSGGIWTKAGTVRNCIITNNKLVTGVSKDVVVTGGSITYSCSPDLTSGTGNTTGDPQFENRSSGNYRLTPGSVAIDSGTLISGVTTDRSGSSRPTDGDGAGGAGYDMGCYEAAPANAGVFRCGFSTPVTVADSSLNATFTSTVYGPQTSGLYYRWDFDGNGTVDEEGADQPGPTHLFNPGTYTVSLSVSNSIGEVATYTRPAYITVYAPATFVSQYGGNTTPYATWASAARSIQDAVNSVMAGGTVTVSNGTYSITANVNLFKAVTVQSVNGSAVTIIKRDGSATTRLFSLMHADALLDGFYLMNGISPTTLDRGGGIYMTAGTVRNCVISNCVARLGGGIYLENGAATNCVVMNCKANQSGNSHSGGGIWMSGGLTEDCEIFGCTSLRAAQAVTLQGGVMNRCRVRNNSSATGWGAAIFMEVGSCTLKNSLVTDNINSGTHSGGGGVYMNHASARILNSTICNNSAAYDQGAGGGGTGGGGVKCVLGVISNSIIYYNTITASGAPNNIGGTTGTNKVRFSCSPDLTTNPTGTGNITAAPGFTDYDNDDFSLGGGSLCIDAGATLPDVITDLDGLARPQDGDGIGDARYDMGCYEAPDAGAGPLAVNFLAPLTSGGPTLEAVFTAAATGDDSANLFYWWDFDFNGTPDTTGWNRSVVTNLYTVPGRHTVSLTVSNASAVVATATKPDYITVLAPITYVATNAPHIYPFTSPATAATNIQEAIDATMSGGTVRVDGGLYKLANQVNIIRGVAVRSESGASATFIQAVSTARLFGLGHANAVLDGFTLRNTDVDGIGGAVNMSDGTVMNCMVTNNRASHGGGIYMTGGVVTNCAVIGNQTDDQSGGGIHMTGGLVVDSDIKANYGRRAAGGIYMGGGEVRRCRIWKNTYIPSSWGAALWLDGACLARNCLIFGNLGGEDTYGGGGGVRMNHAGARLENCTVVGNQTAGSGGGVKLLAGTVTNCIVFFNSATVAGNNILLPAIPKIGYSCSPDLTDDPSGTGNTTGAPLFVDAGTGFGLNHVAGDYRLKTSSLACIDKGITRPGMATDVDLAQGPRLLNKSVDMGAYETFVPPPGTILLLR
jgi:hypothetical protein